MNGVNVSQTAIERILDVTSKAENQNKFLRVSISGGGYSGFQYIFALDEKKQNDDVIIAQNGEKNLAITDETSMQFLSGAEIQFVKELGASYFKVINPNASSNCGCGSSFSV